MGEDRRAIEKRIARLREQMRLTLDRKALPALRDQLVSEIAKLSGVPPA
jgi:hypothetical protein